MGHPRSPTTYPTAPAATPNCWHLPTTTEITLIYDNNQLLTHPLLLQPVVSHEYWTSTQAASSTGSYPEAYIFRAGYFYQLPQAVPKAGTNLVRAVRAF
jgi:hypothetical protein